MWKLSSMARWMPAAPVLLAAAVAGAGPGEILQAGCNCNQGSGGGATYAPVAEYMPPADMGEPAYFSPSPAIDPGPASPPPGTLGRTYELPTRLIPADKHPRTAMLHVRSSAEEVIVSHTNEFREEDDVKAHQDETDTSLWRFETKPLLPGIPHVYKVEAVNGGVTTDVRYVRLLRGRILELQL